MNNYQPRAPHPGRTAVEPCHTTVHATSCNTQSTPGEGMRIGEVLGLRISDFVMGRGGTPYVEIVPRLDNPNGWFRQVSRIPHQSTLNDRHYVDDHALAQIPAALPLLGLAHEEQLAITRGDGRQVLANGFDDWPC